jgi:hypothetical protein
MNLHKLNCHSKGDKMTTLKIKVDSKVKNHTAKQVEFLNQFTIAFLTWKDISKGGLLPDSLEQCIGNKVDRNTKDKFFPDAKRSMDFENLNAEGFNSAIMNYPKIMITQPEPTGAGINHSQESLFFWHKKEGKKMVAQHEKYEKLFNSDTVENFLHGVKIEIQPLFNENRNESDLAHYRDWDNAIQIKERFLQPNNWDTKGLETFVHELVHLVGEYCKISNCSAKQQHNRSFQALAMSMNLRTEWFKDAKTCQTYELDEEFYNWFNKAFDVEHLKKNVFNVSTKQKGRSERKRRKAILNDVPVWIPITRYEQALCQNDCCSIERTEDEN